MPAFLFTDIESSTPLWEEHPSAMREVHSRQRATIDGAVSRYSGRVVKDTGDGVFAVFDDPEASLAAAVLAQSSLHADDWSAVGALRVRMGLHFGHAEVDEDGDLHGHTINRAARVMDAGHGGQIVASGGFVAALPATAASSLSSIGTHRLKGIPEPIELFQANAPGLPDRFPPPRTLDGLPNNLPHTVSRFIGREDETQRLCERLRDERLVTIVGAGGAGKTRLALHVGAELLSEFTDGVWFVDLAGLGEPELVTPTVASALRIPDQPGREWIDSVTRFVEPRELLLVLDNCEHLLDEVAAVADRVLASSPASRVLATSREPLNLRGERSWPITSLSMPGEGTAPATSESVALFLDRADAVRPGFTPSGQELDQIVEICRRLDGLPLAIELAAARLRGLSVGEIAARLDDRFRLLVGGSRTALARQRTLEATVAWSYHLLESEVQRVFDHLTVFAGSFSLSAAERMCETFDVDVLGAVLDLVDKSLLESVAVGEEGARYRMLETLRMFGRDRLIERDVAPDARNALLRWAVEVTAGSNDKLLGPEQLKWQRVFDADIDNLRAAMQWAADRGLRAEGLAVAGELHRYWFDRSAREGQTWLTRFLTASEGGTIPLRTEAQANMALGHLLQVRGDDARALEFLEAARRRFTELGDARGSAWALHYAGRTHWGLGDHEASLAAMNESMEKFIEADDDFGALMSKAFVAHVQAGSGRPDLALEMVAEIEQWGARAELSPTLAAHTDEYAFIYHALALAAEDGRDRLHRAMQTYSRVGEHPCVAHALDTAAYYASTIGDSDTMVALHGVAMRMWDDAGVVVPPWERMLNDELERLCDEFLGDDVHAELVSRGAAISVRDAIQLAMEITSAPT